MEWWTQNRNNGPRPTRGDVRPTVSEITEYLLVGEYPRVDDIEWLRDEHRVTAIHNLQDDEDLRINDLRHRQSTRGLSTSWNQVFASGG